jgi:hypothetical protein
MKRLIAFAQATAVAVIVIAGAAMLGLAWRIFAWAAGI